MNIYILPTVGIVHGDERPHSLMQFTTSTMAPFTVPQIHRLAQRQLDHSKDSLRQFDDSQRISRRDRPHADFVLVVRLCASAENTGGHGEL